MFRGWEHEEEPIKKHDKKSLGRRRKIRRVEVKQRKCFKKDRLLIS